MVCMMSRTGVTTACTLSERAIRMPMGTPTAIDIRVATVMMLSVRMVLSHMPK